MSMLDRSLADESGVDYDEYMSDDLEELTEEDFDDEELDDEEEEYSCGSSCKAGQPKKVSLVSLEGLKKHFDEVVLERMDDFNLLTLRDKANKNNYDWTVWLQVKIPFKDHNSHSGHTDEQYIEGVCKDILDWVDLLKNFEKKSNTVKQLSLFGEELGDDELEVLPEMPRGGEDRTWGKYYRERERVLKNNLKKQYSFFELCNVISKWHVYHDQKLVQSWKDKLPKNDKEMIELVKEAIVKGTSSKKGYGRFNDYWWDDEYKYLTRDGALSDYEIVTRVKRLIRLYLVPYTENFHVSTDLSYTAWPIETQTRYRFWFDGVGLNGSCWLKSDDLPSYELFDLEFVDWLRNHFNIAYKAQTTDEEILKEGLELFLGNLGGDDYDVKHQINIAKTWQSFKADILSKKLRWNTCSPSDIDGYDVDFVHGKKMLQILVKQNIKARLLENKNMDLPMVEKYDQVIVYDIKGDEIFKKAFELFKKETVRQTTLFDFLAA